MKERPINFGISCNQFYTNTNRRRLQENGSRINDLRNKRNHDDNELNESNMNLRDALSSTEKIYEYNRFPDSCLLTDTEAHYLQFGPKSSSKKSRKTHKSKHSQFDENNSVKKKRFAIKLDFDNSPAPILEDPTRFSFNQESINNKNIASDEKQKNKSSQKDIRSYYKSLSPQSPSNSLLNNNAYNENNGLKNNDEKSPDSNDSNKENNLKPLKESQASDNNKNSYDENDATDDNYYFNEENTLEFPATNVMITDPEHPLGLPNLFNTCYMNSFVQALFNLSFFMEKLKKTVNDHNKRISSNKFEMTLCLLDLFEVYDALRHNNSSFENWDLDWKLRSLKKSVGDKIPCFNSDNQQDVAEFFDLVIGTIKEEFEAIKLPDDENPISSMFSYTIGSFLVCKKCGNKVKAENDTQNTLHLSIPDDKSLQTSFTNILKDEFTGHKCASSQCDAHENVRTKHFIHLPKVLFMQLGRYAEDGRKCQTEIHVPLEMYFPVNQSSDLSSSLMLTPKRAKLTESKHNGASQDVEQEIILDNNRNEADPHSNSFAELNSTNLQIKSIHSEMNGSLNKDENTENPLQNNILSPLKMQHYMKVAESNSENDSSSNVVTPNICKKRSDEHEDKENERNDDSLKYKNSGRYELAAIICHHGSSLVSGHYTCYVFNKQKSQWFLCDDQTITSTDFFKVADECKISGYCFVYILKN